MCESERHVSRLDEAEKQVWIVLNQLDADHPRAGDLLQVAETIEEIKDDVHLEEPK